jgi:hypothetical protein
MLNTLCLCFRWLFFLQGQCWCLVSHSDWARYRIRTQIVSHFARQHNSLGRISCCVVLRRFRLEAFITAVRNASNSHWGHRARRCFRTLCQGSSEPPEYFFYPGKQRLGLSSLWSHCLCWGSQEVACLWGKGGSLFRGRKPTAVFERLHHVSRLSSMKAYSYTKLATSNVLIIELASIQFRDLICCLLFLSALGWWNTLH